MCLNNLMGFYFLPNLIHDETPLSLNWHASRWAHKEEHQKLCQFELMVSWVINLYKWVTASMTQVIKVTGSTMC